MRTVKIYLVRMPRIKHISILVLSVLLSVQVNAQEQDLGFRGETGLRYRINKKSNIDFSYRVDLKENLGQFRRANFSFAYERKVNKWIDLQLYYRYITSYKQDKNRFRIALSTDKKIYKKTKLQFRTLLQHDVEYFDGDYLREYKPRLVWRNRLLLSRRLNKRWSSTIYTEPFISKNYKGFHPYRLRTGASLSYAKKRWKYSAEYFYQNEFYFEQSSLHVIGLGVRYDITRVIRPKKKKNKKKSKQLSNKQLK